MTDEPSSAISVRLEHRSESRSAGQRRHDLREGPLPRYVDQPKMHLNTIILEPMRPAALRQICEERRASRAGVQRAMKSDAAVSTHVIITFGRAAQPLFEALPVEVQDRAYRAVADRIAAELGVHVTGLVAHRDETAPHAHGQFPSYRPDGQPVSKFLRPAMASRLQDLAAEVIAGFAPGITRGKRKADRISDGEDLSRIVHRSVRQLHQDLPREIAAARDEASAEEARLDLVRSEVAAKTRERDERAAEAQKLAERVAKLEAKAELTAAEEKRLETYRRRHEAKAQEAERLAAEVTAAALALRAAAAEEAAQVQADRQALNQEKEALATVTEQIEDGIALAVSLVADGSLRMTPRGVDVPPEHRATLRTVWPLIGPAMGQMMTLRARWVQGIARLRDLFGRNKVAIGLRDEAWRILEEAPHP